MKRTTIAALLAMLIGAYASFCCFNSATTLVRPLDRQMQ
jgi:hypothetical protein